MAEFLGEIWPPSVPVAGLSKRLVLRACFQWKAAVRLKLIQLPELFSIPIMFRALMAKARKDRVPQ
jgi:hypothetical protein